MQTYMLLQADEAGQRMLLRDPVMLFDGSLSYERIQRSRHSDRLIVATSAISISGECQNGAPCIVLQGSSSVHYLLDHAMINAGVGRYSEYTASEMQARWQAAKLKVDAQLNNERLYLVHCIDHVMLSCRRVDRELKPLGSAIAIVRNDEHMIVQSSPELSEETLRALEVFASRALYALWLDIGSVLVAVSGTGSMAVREVWSIEQQQLPIDRELLSKAIHQWLQAWERDARKHEGDRAVEEAFQLGADPEFIIVNSEKKVVSASDYLLDYNSMYVGVDALLYKNKLIYPIVELRPAPEANPNRLFVSLHRLMKEASLAISDDQLHWLAGGMPIQGIALGGHLHISGIRLTPRLLRVLDAMLAIPFAAVADPAGKGRLRKFGGLGDYRRQFHGGFEYRTLPSWLVSPALTRAAIACCWLAVANRKELAALLTSPYWLDELYQSNDRERLVHEALHMLELLSKLAAKEPAYELGKALAPLVQALQQRKTWNEQIDLRKRWSLIKAVEPVEPVKAVKTVNSVESDTKHV